MSKVLSRTLAALIAFSFLVPAAPAAAQTLPRDVITVGTATTSATTVDVPVYIRDVSGTPLGLDQPPGSRIQAYSIRVNYAPTAPVQSVTFTRAGITAGLTPIAEFTPSSPGSISLIDSFDETTNLIPFTLNAAAPGNQIGRLSFTLAPGTAPGTVIALTLDATLTQLSNQGGTTAETVVLGTLTLVNGSITVTAAPAPPAPIPTAGQWGLLLFALTLVVVACRRI
jgi:hypothetical protein